MVVALVDRTRRSHSSIALAAAVARDKRLSGKAFCANHESAAPYNCTSEFFGGDSSRLGHGRITLSPLFRFEATGASKSVSKRHPNVRHLCRISKYRGVPCDELSLRGSFCFVPQFCFLALLPCSYSGVTCWLGPRRRLRACSPTTTTICGRGGIRARPRSP